MHQMLSCVCIGQAADGTLHPFFWGGAVSLVSGKKGHRKHEHKFLHWLTKESGIKFYILHSHIRSMRGREHKGERLKYFDPFQDIILQQ